MPTWPQAHDPISEQAVMISKSLLTDVACAVVLCLGLWAPAVFGQQYNSDNQWTAPRGVGTGIVTVGQDYSALVGVAALFEDWEFNVGLTSYYEDPQNVSDRHNTGALYVKHRLWENEQATGGAAILAGTGVDPSYIRAGTATDTLKTWWASYVYTIPFNDGRITWDLLPGVLLNLNQDRKDEKAWGMTYSTRLAIYDVIPQSAIVSEVFGTAGEGYAKPSYRFGVRWESEKLIIAVTYSNAFDGSGGAGFEVGLMYLTDPRFCFGGCRK